jgi:hypothetical protein
MSIRAVTLDRIIGALEGLDGNDLDFVLSGVAARFPKGNRAHVERKGQGVSGRGGRGGRNPPKQGAAWKTASAKVGFEESWGDKVPPASSKSTSSTGGGYGRGGGLGLPKKEGPTGTDSSNQLDADSDLLDLQMEVRIKIESMGFLAKVARDPAANSPEMARDAVQKRLIKKRKELHAGFLALDNSPSDGWLGFCTLNSLQKFRLALSDSIETENIRLGTDPMPATAPDHFDFLKEIASERAASCMVSNQGFYTNDDKHYADPKRVSGAAIGDGA